VAVEYKARTVLNRSNADIMGSNPARSMGVYQLFIVLCCPV